MPGWAGAVAAVNSVAPIVVAQFLILIELVVATVEEVCDAWSERGVWDALETVRIEGIEIASAVSATAEEARRRVENT